MSPTEARVVLLEAALIQSHHTISFLHGCLTQPAPPWPTTWWGKLVDRWKRRGKGGCRGYTYGYPDQTLQRLAAIERLVTIPESCYHSVRTRSCPLCAASMERARLRTEARKVLGLDS